MRSVKLFTSKPTCSRFTYLGQIVHARSMVKSTFLTKLQVIPHRFLQSGAALVGRYLQTVSPFESITARKLFGWSEKLWSILLRACVPGTNPPINLAVKANPELVADRESSLRASQEVAGKTAHCPPGFLSVVHESACEYVTVIVNLPCP